MNEVLAMLNEIRPEEDFGNSKDYLEDGLLDSMDIVELVSKLEEIYAISIDINDLMPENFRNLDSIVLLVNKYNRG